MKPQITYIAEILVNVFNIKGKIHNMSKESKKQMT